jgi:hypothetical protein
LKRAGYFHHNGFRLFAAVDLFDSENLCPLKFFFGLPIREVGLSLFRLKPLISWIALLLC